MQTSQKFKLMQEKDNVQCHRSKISVKSGKMNQQGCNMPKWEFGVQKPHEGHQYCSRHTGYDCLLFAIGLD